MDTEDLVDHEFEEERRKRKLCLLIFLLVLLIMTLPSTLVLINLFK